MKLKKLFWGVSLCVVCMFLLEHVAGIHINRELQNLSIESEGDIKRDDPTGSSKGDSNIDSNSSNNSSSSNSNNNNSDSTGPTEDSEDINNNDTQANGMANQSNEFEEFNNNSQKYSIFNGTFDFKNTRFEDGIAYDSKFERLSAEPLNLAFAMFNLNQLIKLSQQWLADTPRSK